MGETERERECVCVWSNNLNHSLCQFFTPERFIMFQLNTDTQTGQLHSRSAVHCFILSTLLAPHNTTSHCTAACTVLSTTSHCTVTCTALSTTSHCTAAGTVLSTASHCTVVHTSSTVSVLVSWPQVQSAVLTVKLSNYSVCLEQLSWVSQQSNTPSTFLTDIKTLTQMLVLL